MSAIEATRRKILATLSRWRGTMSTEERALFRDFVRTTLPKVRGPFLAQHPPKEVIDALAVAFMHCLEHKGTEPKVDMRKRSSRGMMVLCSMPDQPFVVDTIRLFLRVNEAPYWGGFNLVFHGVRDAKGRLVGFDEEKGCAESLVLLEADYNENFGNFEVALPVLQQRLQLAQAMVRDFKPMTGLIDTVCALLEGSANDDASQREKHLLTRDFLVWLAQENFVFMGAEYKGKSYGFQTVAHASKGTADGDWPLAHAPHTVKVRKDRAEAPVHRSGRIDEILVELPDGSSLFLRGLFTYRAVTQPSRNVPILRGVLAKILANQAQEPGSFRYKGIANVFDSLPTEFLFTATEASIGAMVDLVFESEQQQEVGVTILKTGRDSAFCLVAMPKRSYGEDLRQLLEDEIVDTMHATYRDHGIFVGRYDTVLLHYYMTGVSFPGEKEIDALTQHIRSIATPWVTRLWSYISEHVDEATADRLTDTYGNAFPESWCRETSPERALQDIMHLEALSSGKGVRSDMFVDKHGTLLLRLYQVNNAYLTQVLPILDNFGLVLMDANHTTVKSRGGSLHIDTFRVSQDGAQSSDELLANGQRLAEGIQAVFSEHIDSDPLNALVGSANLTWAEVDVLRGYMRYAYQLVGGLTASRATEVMLTHPKHCANLAELFNVMFDPKRNKGRAKAMQAAAETVNDDLRLLRTHDEHMVFSTLGELVNGTVRTNAFRGDRSAHYLSFKFDCKKVDVMGPQRPMFEIFVHSREVEGVHLRFGKVARGGLRWSDRDDFRREVLGLATTQLVKNVVIVPTGSKGGFLLKYPSADRGVRRQQADTHYKTFIRGLLDVTDNAIDGKIIPAPGVVRHDEDDPYLVVAADKGTAHLSDTANGISQEYGYWLDDAFASGGSNGYDHKGVGITARGGWVLVRRHFAELGRDPYSEPFTCAGIGDMGGDVFGNGLIESPHVQLKAAFNHLHIFLDPNPHATKSAAELQRLFDTQGGWDKFNTKLLSKGGGIYDRRAKSIALSPEVRQMLGIEAEEAQPEVIINRILQMDVDLLWNGGIGTYVKASDETHEDANDRGNNAVRIDATMLRARIVGEGGNLGFTAKARIEAGLHGVRLNTDFIDNSGGVDLSDHEVNLKILLQDVVARGEINQPARNKLLRKMTNEVADLVLANNDAHGRQLSRDQIRSQQDIFQFGRSIAFVERAFGQTREALNLPSEEVLSERANHGLGLTRPELSTLSAWVKMYIQQELIADDPTQLPGFDEMLTTYFPKAIQKSYPERIRGHMLAHEIVAMVACTRVVADAGAAFVPMMLETSGGSVRSVMSAYLKAQQIGKSNQMRKTLEEMRTQVPLEELYGAWVAADNGIKELVRFWLSTRGRIPEDEELAEMTSAVAQVYKLQTKQVMARDRSLIRKLTDLGISSTVALQIVKARYLNVGLMIWAEARRTTTAFKDMVIQHMAVAQASRLQEVLDDLAERPASGTWDPIATKILHSRFHQLLRNVVARTPFGKAPKSVDALEQHLIDGVLADVRGQVCELLDGETSGPTIAALLVLEERVTSAIERLPTD